MANVGRYIDCPAVLKIRGNRRSLRQWLLRKLRRNDGPDLYPVSNCYPVYYPAGYKK